MNRVTEIYAVILPGLASCNKRLVLELSSRVLTAFVSIGSLLCICLWILKLFVKDMKTFTRLLEQSVNCQYEVRYQNLFSGKRETEYLVFPFFNTDYHFSLYKNVVLLLVTSEKFLCSSLHCVSVGWRPVIFT